MFGQQKGHENRSYRKKTNKGEITYILAIFQSTCHLLYFHRNKNRMIAIKSSWISVFIQKVDFDELTTFSCLCRGAAGYECDRRRTRLVNMALRSGRQAWGEYCSIFFTPTSMFLPRTHLRLHLHTENAQEGPEMQTSGSQTFDHLTCVVRCYKAWCMYMSGCSKMKQQVPHDCWGKRMRRSCLESVLGLHQRLVSRKNCSLLWTGNSCGLLWF